jgi:hypothetical protein
MNKGEIRVHFKALLNRTDCSDTLADTFIDQATARIQRLLRVPSMERTLDYALVASTSFIVVPNDLLEIINVSYAGNTLDRIPNREMNELIELGETGSPRFFMRQRENIYLYPVPSSGTVQLDYYSTFPTLATDADSNTLTVMGSDALTYTALGYASDYFMDERGPLFEQKASQFISEIQDHADQADLSGTTQVIRPSSLYIE